MNKSILYVLAAVVGIGAAVALFPKSEAPDPNDAFLAAQAEGEAAQAKAPQFGRDAELPKRAPREAPDADAVEASPKGAVAAQQAARDASVAGNHVKMTMNKWQGLALELGRAGQTEAADRCREMTRKMNDLRRVDTFDLDALLAEEEALLAEVTAGQSAEGVRQAAELIEAAISEARAAPPPAP